MVLHFLVKGRVQGVGYRWFVHHEASLLGLRGWVRNTDEGEVEIVAAGSAPKLSQLRLALHRGPRGSRVDQVAERELPEREAQGLPEFQIEGAW